MKSKTIVLSLLAFLLLIAAVFIFILNKQPENVETISNTNSNESDSNDQIASNSSKDQPSTQKDYNDTANISSNAELIEPYGTFISNHEPDSSDSSANVVSICITSPGATCYIQFTNNGSTKKLEAQATDQTGKTSWHWNTQEAGLYKGSWKITAIAKLNDQEKLTTDQIDLVIK